MDADGSIDITRALQVNVEVDLSRRFWSHLVRKGAIASPEEYIHPVPYLDPANPPKVQAGISPPVTPNDKYSDTLCQASAQSFGYARFSLPGTPPTRGHSPDSMACTDGG